MKITEWRDELKAAELGIEKAQAALDEAKAAVGVRKKALDRASQRHREVLRAFVSGESQLPLFVDSLEDDDQVETVPTAIGPDAANVVQLAAEWHAAGRPFPIPGSPAYRRAAEAAELDGEPARSMAEAAPAAPGTFTGADVNRQLEYACTFGREDRWADLRKRGASDSEILTLIGEIWAGEGYLFDDWGVGQTTSAKGGKAPKFWMGARRKDNLRKPHFEGESLATAVRLALGIRHPAAEPSAMCCDWLENLIADVERSRAVREDLAVADRLPGLEACERPADGWRSDSLIPVLDHADLWFEEFEPRRIDTLGVLADAFSEMGVRNALGAFLTDGDIDYVLERVREWVAKHPGFPLELLAGWKPNTVRVTYSSEDVRPMGDDQVDAAEAAAVRFDAGRAEVLDAELLTALYPEGFDPGWAKYRKLGGLSNIEAARKLCELWPASPDYRCDQGVGLTVRGGRKPAVWLGELTPGKLPVPDLEGPELYDAMRKVLQLPKLTADDVDPIEASAARAELGEDAPCPERLGGAIADALRHLPKATMARLMKGASDKEILEALKDWGTFKRSPGLAGGKPWAIAGGDKPGLWFGQSADRWPDASRATLSGEMLAKHVRIEARIPRPPLKSTKPKAKKSKAGASASVGS